MMMPISSISPSNVSFMPRAWMNSTAAGQRCSIFSFSCRNEAGGSTMRLVSRDGCSSARASGKAGRTLSRVAKRPWTWQARIRTSSITGVFDASDSSKDSCTALTIDATLGRGSTSQSCDFIAKACERSCMMEEPSP
jgi:hypothetical protein